MKRFLSRLFLLCILIFVVPFSNAETAYPFTVYFLDVGQGDCAVILSDGHAMMIDGGDAAHSSYVYSFLRSHGIDHLDYMIATHPDADHIGGLSGALHYAKADMVFCSSYKLNGSPFQDFLKTLNRYNLTINIPEAGDVYMLGSARVEILMPIKGAEKSSNSSIVLRVVYGDCSFLFTGDSEEMDEAYLLASGQMLESTVLKVAHHGSSSSTSLPFLQAVNPRYAVISVGGHNDYGHPTRSVLNILRNSGVILYRTDMQGIITCQSDGTDLIFSTERNADANTFDHASGYSNSIQYIFTPDYEAAAVYTFIVNKNSGVFHKETCGTLPLEKNRLYITGTVQDMLDMHYTACSRCHPERP